MTRIEVVQPAGGSLQQGICCWSGHQLFGMFKFSESHEVKTWQKIGQGRASRFFRHPREHRPSGFLLEPGVGHHLFFPR
jgi:hypothetical protein